jgi:hypothetical protein
MAAEMRSAPQPACERDRTDRAGDDRDGIDVCELAARIEERDQNEAAEPAKEARYHDLSGNNGGAAGAAVMIGQVPLAVRTGRHSSRG